MWYIGYSFIKLDYFFIETIDNICIISFIVRETTHLERDVGIELCKYGLLH